MTDRSLSSDDTTLVAQAGETVLTIDPDSGEGLVSVQSGQTVDLSAFELAGSSIAGDGGELLVTTQDGTVLRIAGLGDEPINFSDGTIDGETLSSLADIQSGTQTQIAAIDSANGPVTIALSPGEPLSLSSAGVSNGDASLVDGNQVALDIGGREVLLTEFAGQSVNFAEGTLNSGELVALLAARRAGLGQSDLEIDLSDGSADIEVMSGVPVDLSAISTESIAIEQVSDGFTITLADDSTINILGIGNEPVVFADTILRSDGLIALAQPGPAATDVAAAVPDNAVVDADTGAITVTVEPGETVDLSAYPLADSTVVLDGEDVVITLADGQVLRIVGLSGETVEFADTSLPGPQFAALAADTSTQLLAPAAGPAAGPAAPAPTGQAGDQQGGGTVIAAQQQGALGNPLPLSDLIDPTELAFSGIEPDPGLGDDGDDPAAAGTGGPGDDPGDGGGGPDPDDPSPIAFNAQIPVTDAPVAPQVGSGASARVPIDIGDDGPGPGTTARADRDTNEIGNELVGIDDNDGRILDGLLVVELPRFGTLLFDFDDGNGLTPITADMLLNGADETVFPIEAGNDFVYQAHGVYGDGAATWQRAIEDGIVQSITANSIGGDDVFTQAEVSNADGAGNLNNTNALGVVGNTTYQDRVDIQLGHDSRAGTGSDLNVSTEGLRIDFAVDIAQMNFDVTRLFSDEFLPSGQPAGDEVGQWTVFNVDANGDATVVATDTFTGIDPVNNSQTQGALQIQIDPGLTFNRIEFTALPYSNAPDVQQPTGPNNYESSDYQVNNINVLPADGDSFQYTTFVDNNANEAYDPAIDDIAPETATVYLDTEIV